MGVGKSTNYVPLTSGDDFWTKVPLFKCLPKDHYPQLTACSHQVEFEAGRTIFEQGSNGDEFFVLQEGSADVIVDGLVNATVGPGDYFGEVALLVDQPRSATITAKTKLKALKIKRTEFLSLGLHEKLTFPKRDKINKRHMMMAAGAAGVAQKKDDDGLGGAMTMAKRMSATPSQKRLTIAHNCGILKDILTDRLNITAFLFVPLGQAAHHFGCSPGTVFFLNFCAIIPLASILGGATEHLATHTGQLVGGLLNATFGNAVEMIMCVQAVKKGLVRVVQGNLLGSILSNLLLVLGMAIVASGVVRKKQKFNQIGAASNMTCQLVASISVCLPTVFSYVTSSTGTGILLVSRFSAIVLMSVYGLFLFFMLNTHAELFADEEDEEDEEGTLSATFSVALLVGSTVTVFFCSECLVGSIEPVSHKYGLSKTFIGVILLPIVGNAAEHYTAVSCAYRGMMDLALGVAVGSSTQIALFVVPCAIMFGWYFDQPMNLNFTAFDTVCQMLTVFLVSQVLSHGETNWLHGAMLMTVYVLIAAQTLLIHETPENAGRQLWI